MLLTARAAAVHPAAVESSSCMRVPIPTLAQFQPLAELRPIHIPTVKQDIAVLVEQELLLLIRLPADK